MHVDWKLVARGIIAPEGPAVDLNGRITLVSRWTGKVVRVNSAGGVTDLVHTGGKPQSVTWTPAKRLLLADAKNHALQEINPDTGSLSTIADSVNGRQFLGPNDLVVGDNDVVYLTDPGLEMEAPGQIVRIELASGRTSLLAEGLRFPNGITITADGRWLMVAESITHRVLQFELLEHGSRLGPGEIFCEFADHHPDGIAFDAEGNLLVALCGGGTLEVVSPQGKITASIPTGGKNTTNCVFGGPDFQTLFVTDDDQQAVLSTRWGVSGQTRYSRSQTNGATR
ncbi:MAG: hypothetical protein EXS05_10685 [Planctomycetaceae bacterium]|nr:hypothetical protein [Planctomycetaceae bacterium]